MYTSLINLQKGNFKGFQIPE